MLRNRLAPLVLGVVLLISGCGGEMSLTEYVEEINSIVARASQRYEALIATPQGAVLVAEGAHLLEFTPRDLHAALERVGEIGDEVQEATGAVEPPDEVADLHAFWFETDDQRFTSAQAALAARAGTTTDWDELSVSPEMAAYRAALAADKEACADFQAKLDATEERGVFADTPWIPGELKEVVDILLGCEGYPEHPEDVYRPPPDG